MIYDGLVYGESKVIIQKGNTHNLKRGRADEIDRKCNCLEIQQASNGLPGVGVAHGLEQVLTLRLALFSQGRVTGMGRVVLFPWDGSWGWLLCQKGNRTTDKVGWPDFPLSPVGGKCPRRVVCQGMGPVSAPGASSRPGARTFLALPAFQSRRGWTFGISGFHGTCSGYGFISEAWWW